MPERSVAEHKAMAAEANHINTEETDWLLEHVRNFQHSPA